LFGEENLRHPTFGELAVQSVLPKRDGHSGPRE
jgi:hypothetical protein